MKKMFLGFITGVMIMGSCMTASAAEFTVTDQSGVCYSNDDTVVYADADLNGTVVLPDVQAGLPICVTGITSNGFFCVNLGDGNVYYIPGYGLSATADASATTTATSNTTTTAVPAKANGKYVCVIDEAYDYELMKTYMNVECADMYTRADYTDNAIYIYLRDQLESQIASGAMVAETQYTCQVAHCSYIIANLYIDLLKAYPQYQNVDSDFASIPEYYRTSLSDKVGFTDSGDRMVTYYITLSCDPTAEARAAEQAAKTAQQAAEVYAKIAAAKAGKTWH